MKTLEFSVKDLHKGASIFHDVEVFASEIGLDIEDVEFIEPIRSQIQLLRYDQDIYAKGNFSALISVECRRCIEPCQMHVNAETELQFSRVLRQQEIDPLLIDGGERYYSGETIDLSDDTRQVITLEMPMWPLCSESCQGLCRCGVNLNLAVCECEKSEESSSPFTVLADLLERKDRLINES